MRIDLGIRPRYDPFKAVPNPPLLPKSIAVGDAYAIWCGSIEDTLNTIHNINSPVGIVEEDQL